MLVSPKSPASNHPTGHQPGCSDACKTAFSPSQIESYIRCNRFWAFKKLAKLPDPQRSFQTLGQAVHKCFELYLKQGTIPLVQTTEGKIALKAIQHADFPKPDPKHRCEEHLIYRLQGVTLHGYADLLPADECAVVDFKTTADLRWAKSEADLRQNVQVGIYAFHQLAKYPDSPTCKIRFVYCTTKSPFATRIVSFDMSRAEVEQLMYTVIVPAAQAMQAAKEKVDVSQPSDTLVEYANTSFTPNVSACDAYGGCPFRDSCTVEKLDKSTQQKRLWSKVMSSTSDTPTVPGKLSLAERMAQKVAAQAAPAIPPVVEKFLADLEADQKAAMLAYAEDRVQINPPKLASAPVAAPPPVADPTPAAEPAAKKRGRPTAKAVAPEAAPPVSAPKLAAVDATVTELPEPGKPLVLCIGCAPMGQPHTSLATVMQRVVSVLNEDAQGQGKPFFELTDEAGFGRTQAVLLNAFIEQVGTLDGFVVANPRDVYQQAVLAYLESKAAVVYRAIF